MTHLNQELKLDMNGSTYVPEPEADEQASFCLSIFHHHWYPRSQIDQVLFSKTNVIHRFDQHYVQICTHFFLNDESHHFFEMICALL